MSLLSSIWNSLPVAETIESSVDLGLRLISPKAANRRKHFRLMENDADYRDAFLATMRARGYKSAYSAGHQWSMSGGSADAEIIQDLPRLRSRSRQLGREDPILCGLKKTFTDDVIGTGLRPQAVTEDKVKNDRIERFFKSRCIDLFPAEDIRFGGAQRLIYQKIFEDGEVFVKQSRLGTGMLWFEVIEADRVCQPPGEKAVTENRRIIDGVERDKHDRIVAYWVRTEHPGEIHTTKRFKWERVERGVMRHFRDVDRPGQTRGVPRCHAVIQDLRDLDLLIVASLRRTQVAASFAAFITSEADIEELMDSTAEKEGYKLDQKLEPGMLFKLYPGEKIETISPNFPSPEFMPFIVCLARRIGAAFGVSWQIVLKDFSEANYSSARTDLLEARKRFSWDRDAFKDVLNWIWRSVLEDGVLQGLLPRLSADDFEAVNWIGNGYQWVDPLKEASATKQKLEIGLTCLRDEAASQGKDYEDLMRQRAKEKQLEMELAKEFGLNPMASAEQDEENDQENDSDDDRSYPRIAG